MNDVWEIYSDQLYFLHHAYGVQIHLFVLMNNHFHLIATFPQANLSQATCALMGNSSRIISFEENAINHLYGGRAFRSRLGSFHYFETAYKYVCLNPVRAGLVKSVEEYPFSTLGGLLGQQRLTIPIAEDTLLFADVGRHLAWLNTLPNEEVTEVVRRALRHEEFGYSRDSSNRPNRLEVERF